MRLPPSFRSGSSHPKHPTPLTSATERDHSNWLFNEILEKAKLKEEHQEMPVGKIFSKAFHRKKFKVAIISTSHGHGLHHPCTTENSVPGLPFPPSHSGGTKSVFPRKCPVLSICYTDYVDASQFCLLSKRSVPKISFREASVNFFLDLCFVFQHDQPNLSPLSCCSGTYLALIISHMALYQILCCER